MFNAITKALYELFSIMHLILHLFEFNKSYHLVIYKTLPIGHKKAFEKFQLKSKHFIIFLHIWILLNLLYLKFYIKSFYFLGDMHNYQTDQCVKKVFQIRSHISILAWY